MKTSLGFTKSLYILAFDHRSSFSRDLLGIKNKPGLTQVAKIKELKQVIFAGFRSAVKQEGVPASEAAVLVDEQYGEAVLRQAKKANYQICLSAEKSGKGVFTLEYGNQFAEHIEKFKPLFVKTLVRYNPEDDKNKNQQKLSQVSELGNWCHQHNYKLLVELLVPATAEQLSSVSGSKDRYDLELRPSLTQQAVAWFQQAGIQADVWKIEGMDKTEDYQLVMDQIKLGGKEVKAVVLGRGEDSKHMERWLKAAKPVDGIIGFAIGRTIFLQALQDFLTSKITEQQVIEQISERYTYFYKVFNS
ncbi:MAG: DUF2090 domain-containing protein [Patescibacteria group bacterium]